jgi:RNA recognition motif-containing protein
VCLQADFDEGNTTLFIGNLAPATTENELLQLLQGYGTVGYVRIPPGKGCGFVQYLSRAQAERALSSLQGQALHGAPLRLSWGRNAAKHAKATSAPSAYMVPPAPQPQPYGAHAGPAAGMVGWPYPGYHPAHAQPLASQPMDVWHGMYGEAAATSGEGVGYGGYTGHPDAKKTASRFGFEDPLHVDSDGANRRFASVAPPMLAPIAMAPARYVMRAGIASTV